MGLDKLFVLIFRDMEILKYTRPMQDFCLISWRGNASILKYSPIGSMKKGSKKTRWRVCFIVTMALFWDVVMVGMITTSPCFAHGLTITPDMQYEYALDCHKGRSYEAAMVEWKRFIHFFPLDLRVPKAKFYLGMSLFHLKKWDQAQAIFQSLRFPYVGSPQNIEAFFMLSKTLLAQGRSGGAQRVLQDLLDVTTASGVKDRALSSLTWIYLDRAADMEPGALEQANAALSRISTAGETMFHVKEVRQVVHTIMKQERKSPFVAGGMALVPGGGFAYCDRYRDALAAFIINTGLIFAAHDSFEGGNNVLGGLICVVESGFYGGNIYGSISSAFKYNRSKIRQKLNGIRHLEAQDMPYAGLEHPLKAYHPDTVMLFSVQIPF